MRILVTGANGFIGKNLVTALRNEGFTDIYEFDKDSAASVLEDYLMEADFVYHLAGVNRPEQEAMFMEGNATFTESILNTLRKRKNPCPVLYSSSVQAALDNPYGASKRAGESAVSAYARDTGAKIYIYRFQHFR
jgi:UDP-2-acetamido-2,6-beta-L-arabino-hexul-4-ose reductase